MLSPSDFNCAVPQFTNGNYASNPVNPQYIAEPSSTDYNRGAEPLQTLPAQWWNWFLNKFTSRFNKLNVYVKNIFNELSQLLSLAEMTPDGTEGTPTVEQLKTMFACCYPSYVKGQLGLGTAAGCDASCFRASTWTPTTVTNACNVYKCMATANTNRQLLLGEATESNSCGMVYVGNSCKATFNPGTGVLTAKTFCGALSGNASTATSSTCVSKIVSGASQTGIIYFCTNCTNASCASTARTTCICGSNGYYYGNICGNVCGTATSATKISRTGYTSAYSFDVLLTNGSSTEDSTVAYVSNQCRLLFCNTTGVLTAKTFCGALSGCACCAGRDGSGCAFGTAARCDATAFRASTWTPSCVTSADSVNCIGYGCGGNFNTCTSWRRFGPWASVTWCCGAKQCDVIKAFMCTVGSNSFSGFLQKVIGTSVSSNTANPVSVTGRVCTLAPYFMSILCISSYCYLRFKGVDASDLSEKWTQSDIYAGCTATVGYCGTVSFTVFY